MFPPAASARSSCPTSLSTLGVVTLILARPVASDTGSEQLAGAPLGYPLAGSGLVKKEVSLEGREQNALCTSKGAVLVYSGSYRRHKQAASTTGFIVPRFSRPRSRRGRPGSREALPGLWGAPSHCVFL